MGNEVCFASAGVKTFTMVTLQEYSLRIHCLGWLIGCINWKGTKDSSNPASIRDDDSRKRLVCAKKKNEKKKKNCTEGSVSIQGWKKCQMTPTAVMFRPDCLAKKLVLSKCLLMSENMLTYIFSWVYLVFVQWQTFSCHRSWEKHTASVKLVSKSLFFWLLQRHISSFCHFFTSCTSTKHEKITTCVYIIISGIQYMLQLHLLSTQYETNCITNKWENIPDLRGSANFNFHIWKSLSMSV